jgi:hypothetical protein
MGCWGLMRKSVLPELSNILTRIVDARFLEHPWSNITDTFFNLEGAAAGG